MATVTSYTAARVKSIEDALITDANFVNGELVFTRFDEELLNTGPLFTDLLSLNKGLRITDDDGATSIDGYRGLLLLAPPTSDEEVCGLVFKIPDPSYGVGQDYTEGNMFVVLSDADNTVAAPVNILKVISGTTNATPVVVTTSTTHGLTTGDLVRITGTGIGALDNKWWKITVLSTTTFSLDTSTAPGSTAAIGSVFTDRSAVLHRLADSGLGISGAVHLAFGLRGRSGASTSVGPAFWIDPSVDCVGLYISNAPTTRFATTPVQDYMQIMDSRAVATRFAVNSVGQTLVDSGALTAPGLTFVGDPDTGLAHLAPDTMNIAMGGINVMSFTTTGIGVANGRDFSFATTTGTRFGTLTTQKLAFWGATPIVKPTGVAVTAAAIHAALVSIGLIA